MSKIADFVHSERVWSLYASFVRHPVHGKMMDIQSSFTCRSMMTKFFFGQIHLLGSGYHNIATVLRDSQQKWAYRASKNALKPRKVYQDKYVVAQQPRFAVGGRGNVGGVPFSLLAAIATNDIHVFYLRTQHRRPSPSVYCYTHFYKHIKGFDRQALKFKHMKSLTCRKLST